jgi:hypothetical protein
MLRPILPVLVSFLVLTNLSEAQVSKPQSAEYRQQSTSDASTLVSLIQQSHDLDHLLPPPMRVWLLTRQAEMVSGLNSDLGGAWANELFALSLQVKGSQRSHVQSTALGILIRLDPDRALDLLHQLSPEDPDARPAVTGPSFCTTANERVYITARGCETLPGGGYGLPAAGAGGR